MAAWAGVNLDADHRATASVTTGANAAESIAKPAAGLAAGLAAGSVPVTSWISVSVENDPVDISIPDTTQLKFWPPRSANWMSRIPSLFESVPPRYKTVIALGCSTSMCSVVPPSTITSKLS